MFTTTWLAYFEGNARCDRTAATSLCSEVPAALRAALALSLGRFQLGEAAGGRIHQEMNAPVPGLDAPTRRSVQLYIEEEWRHARELATLIEALGGRLQTAHWTNSAFTSCRRLLGLRTKMMTLAIAEVVGIVYYRALASGVGSPALARALELIASEESRHLDFQAAFFEQQLALSPPAWRSARRWLLRGLMAGILAAALLVLWLDHGALLRRVGAEAWALTRASCRELARRRFLAPARLSRSPQASYAFRHER